MAATNNSVLQLNCHRSSTGIRVSLLLISAARATITAQRSSLAEHLAGAFGEAVRDATRRSDAAFLARAFREPRREGS
jgi:hypothetical protein